MIATSRRSITVSSAGYVYVIATEDRPDLVKIGYSKVPEQRLKGLATGSPVALSLRATHPGTKKLENHLHHTFADRRTNGEWFDFEGEDCLALIDSAVRGYAPPAPKPPEVDFLLCMETHELWISPTKYLHNLRCVAADVDGRRCRKKVWRDASVGPLQQAIPLGGLGQLSAHTSVSVFRNEVNALLVQLCIDHYGQGGEVVTGPEIRPFNLATDRQYIEPHDAWVVFGDDGFPVAHPPKTDG
ncbi:GIY-YIG nuclease family protein [Streptomyces sp. NPDC086554]|uniref:GIY-YIG nuclease family protein n=1 Tax=Streptomyces sp. NPDC086554 TaxID=3154864 RepID=UPI00342B4629